MRSRWITGGDSCTMIYQNCGDAQGKRKPGKERPVQAKEAYDWKNRHASQSGEVERRKVAKSVSQVPRKAAIEYIIPVP